MISEVPESNNFFYGILILKNMTFGVPNDFYPHIL